MSLPQLPIFWLGFLSGILALALWQHFVKGRIACFVVGCGHAWAVLREEVMRPIRVIRKALSRKDVVELDEIEKRISG